MSKSNNEINKFMVMLMICIIALACSVMCGCRTQRDVVNNTHEIVDSTLVMNTTDSKVEHTTTNVDSLKHELSDKMRTIEYHTEYRDTLYKHYTDHFERTSDSVDVKVDSISGNVTIHYYIRTYERDEIRDTIMISWTKHDSVYMDRELIDRLEQSNKIIDELNRELLSKDSIYKAIHDSINNSEVIVIEKKLSWWDRTKTFIKGNAIGGIIIALIGIISILYFKNRA